MRSVYKTWFCPREHPRSARKNTTSPFKTQPRRRLRTSIESRSRPLTELLSTSKTLPGCATVFRHRRISSARSEEHTSELQSHLNLVCRLLLEKKKSRVKPKHCTSIRVNLHNGRRGCSAQ